MSKFEFMTIEEIAAYNKIHTDYPWTTIGEITINNTECVIRVYDNEGMLPHFHIESIDKRFNCCILIKEPKYFNHGYKHIDVLNDEDITNLINFLNEDICIFSRFDYMLCSWNLHNKNTVEHVGIPDYTKLNINK